MNVILIKHLHTLLIYYGEKVKGTALFNSYCFMINTVNIQKKARFKLVSSRR